MKKISKNEQLFNAVAKWDIVKTKELLDAGANSKLVKGKTAFWGINKKDLEKFKNITKK